MVKTGPNPGETPVSQVALQKAEGLDGGQKGQVCSVEVQHMVGREAWGCAVLVDASPWWLGAAPVKMAPMATFPWRFGGMSSKVARGEESEAQQIPRAAQLLTVRAGRIAHLCQALEFVPWPEEMRVWLLLSQFHPVAVTIEILQGMKSSPKALAGQGVVKGSGCHKGLL